MNLLSRYDNGMPASFYMFRKLSSHQGSMLFSSPTKVKS